MDKESLPLAERLEMNRARGHMQWAREEIMKYGSKIMDVLKEVHDKKSYRFDYASWAEYCRKEWNISAARSYQLINGASFRLLMEDAGGDKEELSSLSERHLDALSKTTAQKAVKAIKKIRKTGGKVTVKSITEEVSPEVLPPKQCLCPHCGQVMRKKRSSSIPD